VHYLLMYDFAPDYMERRAEFRNEHLALAWQGQTRGEVVLGGALADPPDAGLLLFQCDSPATAERFAQADPYVKNGLVSRWRVRKWTTVVGEHASTPMKSA
jgi:uncharacterized protein YciI